MKPLFMQLYVEMLQLCRRKFVKEMLAIGRLLGYEGLAFLVRVLPGQGVCPRTAALYGCDVYLQQVLGAFMVLAAGLDGQEQSHLGAQVANAMPER